MFVRGRSTRPAPAHIEELRGQTIGMVDQRRKALGTDMGLPAGEPENQDGEIILRSAAAETGGG